jgi:hypothetical protein
MRLITRELAEAHLRITAPSAYEEIDLLAKIAQAEDLVLDYVNQRRSDADLWLAEVEAWDVTDTAALPPPQVQAAVLVQLGELYRFRGDDLEADQPVRDLGSVLHPLAAAYLYRHRDPAIA